MGTTEPKNRQLFTVMKALASKPSKRRGSGGNNDEDGITELRRVVERAKQEVEALIEQNERGL